MPPRKAAKTRTKRVKKAGPKRSLSPALKQWIAFVKKVQSDEGCSYKEAMVRAKHLKAKM